MAKVSYSPTSPYYGTQTWGQFLDTWQGRYIPEDVTDMIYQIDPPYNLRPDLLAYDLYGDANLWWVFAIRNPNAIQDPVFDFIPGVKIFLPKKTKLFRMLGI